MSFLKPSRLPSKTPRFFALQFDAHARYFRGVGVISLAPVRENETPTSEGLGLLSYAPAWCFRKATFFGGSLYQKVENSPPAASHLNRLGAAGCLSPLFGLSWAVFGRPVGRFWGPWVGLGTLVGSLCGGLGLPRSLGALFWPLFVSI